MTVSLPQEYSIRLPFPPSFNMYWRHRIGGRGKKQFIQTYISERGKEFRAEVVKAIREQGIPNVFTGRLQVSIELTMPSRRACDVDNYQKALLDALEHAGLYNDDNQIDELLTFRRGIEPPGCADVIVRQVAPAVRQKELLPIEEDDF